MRFQPQGASRFLLILCPLPAAASSLHFSRLPTFHSPFRTGSGSPPLWEVCSNPLPSPTRVRFPPVPTAPRPSLHSSSGSVCPSVHPSQAAASSVRKGSCYLLPQRLAQSWWRGLAHPISWLSMSSRFVLCYFLTFTLGLNVLFLVIHGDREALSPFRGGRIQPHLLQKGSTHRHTFEEVH